MSFLPEDDQAFLNENAIRHELLTEKQSDGTDRRGILLPGFEFTGNLWTVQDGKLVASATCDLLVLIPNGYSTTKLDSFYTSPRLKHSDGSDPQCATGEQVLFGRSWHFWSRHLDDADWRVGKDDLRTYLGYIRNELQIA